MVKLRGCKCKGRGVPVVRCISTTGSGVWWVGCGGVGVGVGVWRLRAVGGAVKEGKGGYVAVDGKDLGEEVGGVDEAGEEDKA